ncbi:hypothetical protein ColTof4_03074 [Colletotrichum tofieldiae]|nr:hypothetical protein ColTof3_13521 [Colletotrichum tofieldiae]GKT70651.1 hypothetical protein ColTof4_03074 [Colletotrichum tofieldiae]
MYAQDTSLVCFCEISTKTDPAIDPNASSSAKALPPGLVDTLEDFAVFEIGKRVEAPQDYLETRSGTACLWTRGLSLPPYQRTLQM